MKKVYTLILVALSVIGAGELKSQSLSVPTTGSGFYSPAVINSLDSVFFDIAQATIVGSQVEIPVYIKSDDIINAVDFQLKYDHLKLDYDTILIQASYIDGLSYYNNNDSTVRLTSYSFSQAYPNDSIIFKIRFTLLSGTQVCSADLNSVAALLNGDACSSGVTDCLTGINELNSTINISLYPNPVADYIIINTETSATITISDISGKVVHNSNIESSVENHQIAVGHLSPGVYLATVSSEGTSHTIRFIKR